MQGYEYDAENPERVSYEVDKDGTLLANASNSTNYLDATGTTSSSYTVRAMTTPKCRRRAPRGAPSRLVRCELGLCVTRLASRDLALDIGRPEAHRGFGSHRFKQPLETTSHAATRGPAKQGR